MAARRAIMADIAAWVALTGSASAAGPAVAVAGVAVAAGAAGALVGMGVVAGLAERAGAGTDAGAADDVKLAPKAVVGAPRDAKKLAASASLLNSNVTVTFAMSASAPFASLL